MIAPRRLLALLSLAAAVAAPPPAAGADVVSPRTITVHGEAQVRVVPDEVEITLGIETVDKELAVAKKANDELARKVLALAGGFGIDPKHVQTDFIQVEPHYDEYPGKRVLLGYFVRKNVVFVLRDVSRFEGLLSAALEAGVNYVHGVQFRTTELRRRRDEARALAIRAAREKAEAMAAGLGQKVGRPLSIQEDWSGWWSPYASWWGGRWAQGSQNVVQGAGGAGPSGDGTVALGQIEVTGRVTVSFELQ
jgi:hypothetical protein